jgi:hypothetical protein
MQFHNGLFTSLGASLKRLTADYLPSYITVGGNEGKADGWTSDVGARAGMVAEERDSWRLESALGVGVRELGGRLEFEDGGASELQRTTVIGACVALDAQPTTFLNGQQPLLSLVLNVDYTQYESQRLANHTAVGLEAAVLRMIYMRAGYVAFDGGVKDIINIGMGVGISTPRFMARFDYAIEPFEVLDTSFDPNGDNKFALTVGVF